MIRFKNEAVYYFQYRKKEIISEGEISAYILTFVDTTHLIAMLDEYELKREAVFKSNVRLRRYRDRVYEIEREKEVNNLLQEIAQNQTKSLVALKQNIEKIDINDENFDNDIDALISRAKSNLSDVRKAVTTYINYYDEGD